MKKGRLWMVLGMAAVLALTGCGAGTKSMSMEESAADYSAPAAAQEVYNSYEQEAPQEAWDTTAEEVASEAGAVEGAMDTAGIESVADTSQKLIKTVDMGLETKEFDSLLSGITGKVTELGGYVETSEISNNSYYNGMGNRSAWMTLRIPADKLEGFVEVVSDMGNVVRKSEQVQDVTLEYVDVESRKKALTTEQERLLVLLENAENIEDIIQIESRLSDIRYELQYYESRLRVMDNQVNYSTVNLNISEVERITEVQEKTFLEEVGYRLSNNFLDIGENARSFAIWFLSSLPYLLIWAVVIVFLVWLVRKGISRRKGSPRLGRKKDARQKEEFRTEETEKEEERKS